MIVAIVVFPGFTVLDAVGPYQVLAHAPGLEVQFVAAPRGPVSQGVHLTLQAEAGLADVPHPDVVVVAGGLAALTMARDGHPIVDWLREAHGHTSWTTSVCTGAALLGAAGILSGLHATSHWNARANLRDFGAVPVERRVVFDGKVVTAAGVSAGIDMSLALLARTAGEAAARLVQLDMEYQPEPPFDAGTPQRAGAATTEHLQGMYDAYLDRSGHRVERSMTAFRRRTVSTSPEEAAKVRND